MSRAHSSRSKDPAKAFISTWNTATTYTGSTANNQIKLPLIATGLYKFTVQWGDGTSNLITSWNQAEVTHTYPTPGIYTVTITGFIKGWDFAGQNTTVVANVTGDRRKITSITQFGCLRFVTFESTTIVAGAFYGCTNLNLLGVTDMPNFKGTTSIIGFVRGYSFATVLNVNKWDVSKITWFRNAFREAPFFNQNLGNWNTSRGVNFVSMFYSGSTISGVFDNGGSDSINNWNVSKATDMGSMFAYQSLFNRYIGDWDVSNLKIANYMFGNFLSTGIFNQDISNWDVSKVTDFGSMFQYQPLFNQPIGKWNISSAVTLNNMLPAKFNTVPYGTFNQDLSNWDTSNVVNMQGLFSSQTQFNQDLGNWDVSKVTNFSYMFQAPLFNNGGVDSLNNWNVSKATTMSRMFQGTFAFNHPLNNWKIPLVTDMLNFMAEANITTPYAFSVKNYSDFIIALAAQPVKPNVQFRVYQYYNASAVAARAILTSAPNNWTFLDRGLQP